MGNNIMKKPAKLQLEILEVLNESPKGCLLASDILKKWKEKKAETRWGSKKSLDSVLLALEGHGWIRCDSMMAYIAEGRSDKMWNITILGKTILTPDF